MTCVQVRLSSTLTYLLCVSLLNTWDHQISTYVESSSLMLSFLLTLPSLHLAFYLLSLPWSPLRLIICLYQASRLVTWKFINPNVYLSILKIIILYSYVLLKWYAPCQLHTFTRKHTEEKFHVLLLRCCNLVSLWILKLWVSRHHFTKRVSPHQCKRTEFHCTDVKKLSPTSPI